MNPLWWFSPEASAALCLTLLHSLWQVALMVLLLWGIDRVWRPRVERSYALHVLGLVLCLAALPATFAISYAPRYAPPAVSEVALVTDSAALAAEQQDAPLDRPLPPATAVRTPLPSPAETSKLQLASSEADLAPTNRWRAVAAWMCGAYLLGVALMLLRLLRSIYRAERLRAQAQPIAAGPLAASFERFTRRFALRLRCTLAASSKVVVPTVVGFVKPTILLPASALTGLSASELEMILVHELAHVRRYDLWVNLLQRLAEVVLFFNPPLWYLSRKIGVLREYCCDELTCRQVATGSEEPRVEYATTLLRVVELARPTASTAELASLAATGRTPSELRRRVARLFGEPLTEPVRLSRGSIWLIGVGLVVCCGVLAQSQSSASDESSGDSKSDKAGVSAEEHETVEVDASKPARVEPDAERIKYLEEMVESYRQELESVEAQVLAARRPQHEAVLAKYQLSIALAKLADARDKPKEVVKRYTEAVEASERNLELHKAAYKAGAITMDTVHIAERRLVDAKELLRRVKNALVVAEGAKQLETELTTEETDTDETRYLDELIESYRQELAFVEAQFNAGGDKSQRDVLQAKYQLGTAEADKAEQQHQMDQAVKRYQNAVDAAQQNVELLEVLHQEGVDSLTEQEIFKAQRQLVVAKERLRSAQGRLTAARESVESAATITAEPKAPTHDPALVKYHEELVDMAQKSLDQMEAAYQRATVSNEKVLEAKYALDVARAELATVRGATVEAAKHYTDAIAFAKADFEMKEGLHEENAVVPLAEVFDAKRRLLDVKEKLRLAQQVANKLAGADGDTGTPNRQELPARDTARIEYLQELVASYQQVHNRIEELWKHGIRRTEQVYQTRLALEAAKGDLAYARGNVKQAVEYYEAATKAAEDNVKAQQSAEEKGLVTLDALLEANRRRAEVKTTLNRLRKELAKLPSDDTSSKVGKPATSVPIHCVDANGHAVAGAEVYVFQHSGGDEGIYQQFGPFSTDNQGRAECDEVLFTSDAGNYDRFYYARVPGKLVGVSRSANWKSRGPFNAEGKIEMRPSQSLTGTVTVPEGFDPTKVAISVRSMIVQIGPGEMDFKMWTRNPTFASIDTALPQMFEFQPDSEGRFRVDDVPVEGRLTIVGEAEGLAEAQWHCRDINLRGPIELNCVKEGVLTGQVTTPDGSPAAGIEVAATIQASAIQRVGFSTTFRSVTDDEGRFELRGLPEWDLVVSLHDPLQRWIARPSEPFFLSPGSSETLNLQLEQGVTVSGQVADADGAPVKGVSIAALMENGTYSEVARASNDAEGRYAMQLPSGTFGLHTGSMPAEFERPEVRVLSVRKDQQTIDDADFTLERKPAEVKPNAGAGLDVRAAQKSLLDTMALVHGYALAEDQVVGRVAPPFAPIRAEWYRLDQGVEPDADPPTSMILRWDGENLSSWGMSFGDPENPGYTLTGLIGLLLDVKSQQLEGPADLLGRHFAGDWILRPGADSETIITQLETILREEFGISVKLKFREVEREVYVVSGRYHQSLLEEVPGEELGPRRRTSEPVHVFGAPTLPDSLAGSGSGEFDEFLNRVGDWIDMPIVDELDVPTERRVAWKMHRQSPFNEEHRRQDHDPSAVLRNISRQTGLEFTKGTRKVEMLFVEVD